MAMNEEDAALLRAHLDRIPYEGKCPICGMRQWDAEGPVCLPRVHKTPHGTASFGPPIVPVVLLVCSTCHYIHHFAWKPLMGKKEAAGG